MKKKPFEIQRWMWIAGVLPCLGVILFCARTVVTFADMPKRVDTIENYIQAQQRANEVQAQANALMQEQLKNQQQQNVQQPISDYCQWYQDANWCWNYNTKQWEIKK